MTTNRIFVILKGGLCQGVCTADPALEGVEFTVIDYDVEGAAVEDLTEIDQGNFTTQEAQLWGDKIGRAAIKIIERA